VLVLVLPALVDLAVAVIPPAASSFPVNRDQLQVL
jgi:hypothetical protein